MDPHLPWKIQIASNTIMKQNFLIVFMSLIVCSNLHKTLWPLIECCFYWFAETPDLNFSGFSNAPLRVLPKEFSLNIGSTEDRTKEKRNKETFQGVLQSITKGFHRSWIDWYSKVNFRREEIHIQKRFYGWGSEESKLLNLYIQNIITYIIKIENH